MSDYKVIKLKGGETLFTEIHEFDEDYLKLKDPFLMKAIETTQNTESIFGTPWIPFTDEPFVAITHDYVACMATLGKDYTKFYGAICLKYKMARLHEEALTRIENGEDEISVFTDTYFKMEETSKFYSAKFYIEEFDLSVYKSKIEGAKSGLVLH